MRPGTVYLLATSLGDIGIMFVAAVTYAPFLRRIGLTLSEITLINGVFITLMVLAQVPTGLFADRYGRALSVKIGIAIVSVFTFAYAWASGFWSALLFEAAVGIGMAFTSGADTAWLTSTLDARGERHRLEPTLATAEIVSSLGGLAAGTIGGLIAAFDPMWTWLVSGTIIAMSFVGTVTFMRDTPSEPSSAPHHVGRADRPLHESVALLRRTPALRWAIVHACVFAIVGPCFHYTTIVFGARVGSFGLAFLWILIYGPKVIGALAMRVWSVRLANGWGIATLTAVPFCMGIGLVVLGTASSLGFMLIGIAFVEVAFGLGQPLMA
ncbi:MFS transporter, partial [Candidatus Uhrbacteria bacterium]|nr:MFS transporter [Candidatus Uhrbacteria bacterium]